MPVLAKEKLMTTTLCKLCFKPIEETLVTSNSGDKLHRKCFDELQDVQKRQKERQNKEADLQPEKA